MINKILPFLMLVVLISCKNEDKNQKTDNLKIEQRKKDSINKVVEKNLKILDEIEISEVSLKNRGYNTRAADVYGSGITMYFTIKNNTDIGISEILLEGEFKFSEREYSYKDEISYEFRKGLEPGEKQEIAMRPSPMSEWNSKIKIGDEGNFNLKLLEIKDYSEKIISSKSN
ncbi:hypothetical protein ACFFFQ_01595 [Mesonia mobilis]|uniref:hypothetical protein n=1 Tax=Mesonia mobilis TaxID=369791 RepID=UPI0035E52665